LFPGDTKTDPISSNNIQMTSIGHGLLNTSADSSSNLFTEQAAVESESLNNIQTPITEPEQEAPDDSKTEGKIKRIVVAKKKDCIFSLAQKYYHAANLTLADFILKSNPEIADIHLISIDQKIKIPEITEESPIIELPDRTFKIHLGTFLAKISAQMYKKELFLEGKRLEIVPLTVSPRETWYRVMAGNFRDKDECLKMITILKEKALLPIFKEKQE
jgi:phage tail protein X